MLYVPRHSFPRADEYACHDRQACERRMAQIGRRQIKRTLSAGPEGGYWLTCRYREHRLVTEHATVDAAKAHVDDLLASWRANSLRDYAGRR